MMASKFVTFKALLCTTFITTSTASAFLRGVPKVEVKLTSRANIERTVQSGLTFGADKIGEYEERLKPLFSALPKGENGTLDHATVRYALHRFFVQQYGWYVKGLEPRGKEWNHSSASLVLKDRVPSYIQTSFEERLHGRGMSLHDLAVFAATLTEFIHREASTDITDLFPNLGLTYTDLLDENEVQLVIKAYMLGFVDSACKVDSPEKLLDNEEAMETNFKAWPDMVMWTEDVRKTLLMNRKLSQLTRPKANFDMVVDVVNSVTHQLGSFQNIECKRLKEKLMHMDRVGNGRVHLSEFYTVGLQGEWLFVETADYLRRLGALEESGGSQDIIIANYVASQANCMASTSLHSVCCFDECDGLLTQVEKAVQAPAAPPAQIVEVVSGIMSETVDAPRNLSVGLVSRLEQIATRHSGMVPLHGRLFSQWMHHVYPLECPFPHVAGTTDPLTPDEWMDVTGRDQIAEEVDVRKEKSAQKREIRQAEIAWTMHEELVSSHKFHKLNKFNKRPVPPPPRRGSEWAVRLAGIIAVIAFAAPLWKASQRGLEAYRGATIPKDFLV